MGQRQTSNRSSSICSNPLCRRAERTDRLWEESVEIACTGCCCDFKDLEGSHLEIWSSMLVILWNFPALKLCSREEQKVMISVSINKAVAMYEWQCSIDIRYFHFLVVHPWITKRKRVFPHQEKIAFGRTSWQLFCELRDLSPQSFCFLFYLPRKVISRREGADQMNVKHSVE